VTPADKQNQILEIKYENEAGKQMKALFRVAFGDPFYENSW
jgi:hypothetical protein